VILRLFFPFGSGQRPPRFIPRLIQRVARGETVDVNEDGDGPFVNPIYIDDLLKRLRDILAAPDRPFYNLGGNEILSLREIAERIGAMLGRSPIFGIKPNRSRSMVCRLMPSVAGHTPFEVGLTATLQEASYL
jgi:nucleoside-diphosphate-sugar epimerase